MGKGLIKVATVKVEGTRPLLCHSFNLSALSIERKPKKGSTGNNPDEWKDTAIVRNKREIYLPGNYVFGCLSGGSAYTKVGRGTIKKKLVATLQVLDDCCPIHNRVLKEDIDLLENEDMSTDPKDDIYLDIRGVQNPNTKGRNIRYRLACSPGWKTTFRVLWDISIVSEEHMRQVFEDSGVLVGIGDGRAIGMGRFKVVDVDVSDFKQ